MNQTSWRKEGHTHTQTLLDLCNSLSPPPPSTRYAWGPCWHTKCHLARGHRSHQSIPGEALCNLSESDVEQQDPQAPDRQILWPRTPKLFSVHIRLWMRADRNISKLVQCFKPQHHQKHYCLASQPPVAQVRIIWQGSGNKKSSTPLPWFRGQDIFRRNPNLKADFYCSAIRFSSEFRADVSLVEIHNWSSQENKYSSVSLMIWI